VYLLGWTTLALKRLDDAETYFQKAAALNPNFPGVYAGLEAVAKERGDVAAQDRWARKRRQLEAKKRQMG
jgi:Tfp pilus assembly protein PilF